MSINPSKSHKRWGVMTLFLLLALYGAVIAIIVVKASPQTPTEKTSICQELAGKLEAIEDKLDLIQAWVCEPELNRGRLQELEQRQTQTEEAFEQLKGILIKPKQQPATCR